MAQASDREEGAEGVEGVCIRPLRTQAEYQAAERLQRLIWGFQPLSVVPDHVMIQFQKHGGLVLGAFDGDGEGEDEEMIGFLIGFGGRQEGRPKHCSLMVGVLPEHRHRGVGYRLKLAQREFVRRQGLELITWTFDPLQAPNAYFNFVKLGVISRRYERDLYGDIRDELNRGLPTDRLTVEWWIESPRVRARLRGEGGRRPGSGSDPGSDPGLDPASAPLLNPPRPGDDGLIEPGEVSLSSTSTAPGPVRVAVPLEINDLKARDPDLALRWRAQTRALFEALFERGYWAYDFENLPGGYGTYRLRVAERRDLLEDSRAA